MAATADTLAPTLSAHQWRMYRGSFWLFILAEAMIFVTLFSTRFLLAYASKPASVNVADGIVVTALLVLSALPARLAVGAAQTESGTAAKYLWITVTLGVLALLGIVFDWITLRFSFASRYGESYLLATGYHALHIVIGLVALAVLAGAAGRGRYHAGNYWPVEAGARFWYFVIVSWVALFVIFELV